MRWDECLAMGCEGIIAGRDRVCQSASNFIQSERNKQFSAWKTLKVDAIISSHAKAKQHSKGLVDFEKQTNNQTNKKTKKTLQNPQNKTTFKTSTGARSLMTRDISFNPMKQISFIWMTGIRPHIIVHSASVHSTTPRSGWKLVRKEAGPGA